MKQKAIQIKNLLLLKKPTSLLIIFSFLFISCNNEKKEPSPNSDTDSKKEALTATSGLSGEFYTLKLSKDQYNGIKSIGGQKIMAQFLFNTSDPKSPTLVAYPARNNDKYFTTASPYNPAKLAAGSAYLEVKPEMILGNQEISYSSIDKFLKDNKIDITKNYTLTFSPEYNSTSKHVYYKISVDGVEAFAGTLSTNPSPPKDAD